jgi:hypothetical protein
MPMVIGRDDDPCALFDPVDEHADTASAAIDAATVRCLTDRWCLR